MLYPVLLSKVTSNKSSVFVLLNLKKAFDLINHKLLTTKLNHYGIRRIALSWLTSFLSNRSQKAKVNITLSWTHPISAGVPQCSTSSNLLFILFINDVFQFSSDNIELYLYANNTAIIFTANKQDVLQNIITNFLMKYLSWSTNNFIIINPNKSKLLCFNTSDITIQINGHAIENSHVAKYLGVYIDDKLSWSYHLNYITRMRCQHFSLFKNVMLYLPNDVLRLYYNAFICSGFSCCLIFLVW